MEQILQERRHLHYSIILIVAFTSLFKSKVLNDALELPVLVAPFGEVCAVVRSSVFKGVCSKQDNVGIPFKVVRDC